MAAMQAHITEHVGMEYKRQMEQAMGVQLPTYEDDDQYDPKMEQYLAQVAVPASQQLLNQNKTAIAAQQAQQAAQDPIIQMQMQELKLKQQEVDLKMRKMQIEAASKADQLEIEKARIAAQKEIAGMQVGAKLTSDKNVMASKERIEGMRLGNDIGKSKAQLNQQAQAAKMKASLEASKHLTDLQLQRDVNAQDAEHQRKLLDKQQQPSNKEIK